MSVKPMTYARAMKLLGMPTPWNDTILKLRYRDKSKTNHPDMGGAHGRMVEVNAAFNCLKNMPEDAREVMFKQHKADNKRNSENGRKAENTGRAEGKRSRSTGAGKGWRTPYDLWEDMSEGFGGGDYEESSDWERGTFGYGKRPWLFGGFGGFDAEPGYDAGYEPTPQPAPPKEEPKQYFEVGGQRYRSGVYGGAWTLLGAQHGYPLSEFEGIRGVIIPEFIDEGTRVTATTSDDDQSSTTEVVIVWNKKRRPYAADARMDVSVGIPTQVVGTLRGLLRDSLYYGNEALAGKMLNMLSMMGVDVDLDYEFARLGGI